MQSNIIIFTDGASSGNPGPGGWGAIVAYRDKVVELGGGNAQTTNNRTELTAVYESLKFVLEERLNSSPITLYTDSAYVANGITSWIPGWKRRNWTNQAGQTIANVDVWKNLSEILPDMNLKIVNISGHSGIPGNEQADKIATGFIKDTNQYLYNGLRSEYSIDLENTSVNPTLKKEKDRKKAKAYSYVSLVGKDFQVHKTWEDCKNRVEGQKGVKYKKALSPDDEIAIKIEWGIK